MLFAGSREGIREHNGGNDLRPRVDQGSAGLSAAGRTAPANHVDHSSNKG